MQAVTEHMKWFEHRIAAGGSPEPSLLELNRRFDQFHALGSHISRRCTGYDDCMGAKTPLPL